MDKTNGIISGIWSKYFEYPYPTIARWLRNCHGAVVVSRLGWTEGAPATSASLSEPAPVKPVRRKLRFKSEQNEIWVIKEELWMLKGSKPLVIICPLLLKSSLNLLTSESMAVSCRFYEVLIRRHLDLLGTVECSVRPQPASSRETEIWAVIFLRDKGSWTRVTPRVHKKSMVHVKAMEVKSPALLHDSQEMQHQWLWVGKEKTCSIPANTSVLSK